MERPRPIRSVRIGDKRTVIKELDPGLYKIDGKQFLELTRPALIEATEEFRYEHPDMVEIHEKGTSPIRMPSNLLNARWYLVGYDAATLRIIPTRWERFKAWITRKPLIPEAVVVVGKTIHKVN